MKRPYLYRTVASSSLMMAICLCFVLSALSLTAPGVTAAVPGDWVQHDDPLGFTVSYPSDWTVKASQDQLILIQNGDGAVFAAILPFFLRQQVTAEQWVNSIPDNLASLFPLASVDEINQIGAQPDEVVASLSYTGDGDMGKALALCSIDGPGGILYAIAAPDAEFDDWRTTLIDILNSFSFTTPTVNRTDGGGLDTQLTYVPWQDPKENAFSLEVPQGWQITGGMVRMNAVDIRPDVQILSPDGQVLIRMGDSKLPPFTAPNATLEMTGFKEGSWYTPGYGVQMMVWHYLTGLEFAQDWATSKLASDCSNLNFTDTRDRQDLSQAVNNVYAGYNLMGASLTMSFGEVEFDCEKGGQPMHGYCFAGTQLTQPTGNWLVQYLLGAIAPASERARGGAILARILSSYRPNTDWVRRQAELVGAVGDIVAKPSAEIGEIMRQTFENESNARDNAARHWSNMILGQTDVVDPATGETYRIASGHNYYWRKGDTIVGTDIDPPNVDFTPLVEY